MVMFTKGGDHYGELLSFRELSPKIKELLTSAPILAVADPSLPYELHVDSSGHSLGAVLYQKKDGLPRVIAYGSRMLKPAEQRYPTHKREFLALKWAITEQFHEYLYGANCTVYTDNNPLTYVLSTAQLDATGHRWLANLAAYQFDIKYKPGKSNKDADGMSRIPHGSTECLSSNVVSAICSMIHTPYVESLAISTDCDDILDYDISPAQLRFWRQAQRDDPCLAPLFPFLQNGKKPEKTEVPAICYSMLKEFDRLRLLRGGMYRVHSVDGKEERRLVLPSCFRKTVLHLLHDDMGHMGRDRTRALVQERFFWPRMCSEIEEYVSACSRCIARKATGDKAPLVPILTKQPLEVVAMDFLGLEVSKGGYQYILVITDLFTRYAVAIPTKNLSAKTTALAFNNNFVVHYGFPGRIHSDQGGSFENKVIRELCNLTGMEKSRTTPYHPAGNGMTERFNSTLLNMLGTLDPELKVEWHSRVSSLVHAYNCTPHSVTHLSPYFLMFGRHPNLPLDIVLDLQRNEELESSSIPQYVKNLRNSLRHAYDVATVSANSGHLKQKEAYDLKARAAILDIGDRVLVRKLHFSGKHKIADRWESAIYVVTDHPNKDVPVYVVKPEVGGRGRTLHRNHLLPIGRMRKVVSHFQKEQTSVPEVISMSECSSHSEAYSDDGDLVGVPQPSVARARREDGHSAGPAEPSGDVVGSLGSRVDQSSESDSSAEEADETISEPRYPQRDRRPPDRYGNFAQSHSTKVGCTGLQSKPQTRPKHASSHRKAVFQHSGAEQPGDVKLALLTKMLDLLK